MMNWSWQNGMPYSLSQSFITYLTLLSFVFLLSFPLSGQQNCIMLIDDFSVDHSFIQAGQFFEGAATNNCISAAGVGGERDIEIILTSDPTSTNSSVGVTSGELRSSLGTVASGSTIMTYDGMDGDATSAGLDPTGLGGVDLTGNGTLNAFSMKVISADEPSTIIVTIYTDGGNFSSQTVNFAGGITNQSLHILYSDFAAAAGSGVDFSNVGAIKIEIMGTELDVRLDEIAAVSTISASKVDAIITDQNMDGQINPGDVVRYTVVIGNAAINTSGSINYTSDIPAETSLVVGSVTATQGSITIGNTDGDMSVAVNVGTITGSGDITITYDVQIDNPLSCTAIGMMCQGMITDGGGLTALPTVDPASAACNAGTETVLTNQLPEIDISGDFDFGTVMTAPGCLSGPITKTVTISNSGTNNLIISTITSSNTEFALQNLSMDLPASIPPLGMLTFDMVFTPQMGQSASIQSMIRINSNDCDEEVIDNNAVIMADATAPEVELTPDLDFGNISVVPGCIIESVTRTMTINNTGNEPLTISNLSIAGSGFSLPAFSLPITIPAADSYDFNVTFTPTENNVGNFTADITMNSNDCDEGTITRNASIATNLNVEEIDILGDLDFGNVMVGIDCILAPVTKQLTISNTGTAIIMVNNLSSNHPDFTINNPSKPLPASLNPTELMTVDITFTPMRGQVGQSVAEITINSSSCSTPVILRSAMVTGDDTICEIPEPIPTMDQWGLLIFGLLILNLSIFSIYQKEPAF